MPPVSTIRCRLEDVHRAAPLRAPGYMDAVLAVGRIDGDWVEWDSATFAKLRERWGTASDPAGTGCRGCGN
jgi:hypothetical protein